MRFQLAGIRKCALKRAAKRYEQAEAKRQAAMTELTGAIKVADVAGVPRNEIQRLSGVSRVTVYRALEYGARVGESK